MCPAADVEAHRQWTVDNPTIEELADRLHLTYHQLYALMRELHVTGQQNVKGGDIRLTPADVTRLEGEHGRRRQLRDRTVPVNVAATQLDVPLLVVEDLLRRGHLEEIPGFVGGPRMVCRESLARYVGRRVVALGA
jgi:hypothetical protein